MLTLHIYEWLCNMLLFHACQQENCFEWNLCTRSCSMDRKEREPNLIRLANWVWCVTSVIPGGQQAETLLQDIHPIRLHAVPCLCPLLSRLLNSIIAVWFHRRVEVVLGIWVGSSCLYWFSQVALMAAVGWLAVAISIFWWPLSVMHIGVLLCAYDLWVLPWDVAVAG